MCGPLRPCDAQWRGIVSRDKAPLCDGSRSSTSSVRRASRVVILSRVHEAATAPPSLLHWVVTPGRKLFVVNRDGERAIRALRMARPSVTPVLVFIVSGTTQYQTHKRTQHSARLSLLKEMILIKKLRFITRFDERVPRCSTPLFFSAFLFRCVSTVMIWWWKKKNLLLKKTL